MIAVITGDIIASRKQVDPENFLNPLKEILSEWGESPSTWEVYRGDSFQLEIADPREALKAAFRIKAKFKSLNLDKKDARKSGIDVRLSIGIGDKDYSGERVTENNGSAFVNSGLQFDKLKEEKMNLSIKTPWPDFDKEINLYLKLILIVVDDWTIKSGELVTCSLKNPELNQSEIGEILGIEQNSVSGRMKRARLDELLELDTIFRNNLNKLIK